MTEIAFQTSEAGTQLGVSHSMMRKIAQDYEAVFGTLGEPRMFTLEILATIKSARNLVHSGLAPSLKVALESLKDDPEGNALPTPISPTPGAELAFNRTDMEALLRDVITPMITPLIQQNEMLSQQTHQLILERQQLLTQNQEIMQQMRTLQDAIRQLPQPRVPTAEEVAAQVVKRLPEPAVPVPSDQIATVEEVGDRVSEKVGEKVERAVRTFEEDLFAKMPNTMSREEFVETIKQTIQPLEEKVTVLQQQKSATLLGRIAHFFRNKPKPQG